MSVVLRENEWAKQIVESRNLGTGNSETMRRIARYYLDLGCNKQSTKRRMEEFLLRCDPDVALPKWYSRIDAAVKLAAKTPAVDIKCLPISQTELDKIDNLDGRLAQRLAFTLLCLAKYWMIVDPKKDCWVVDAGNEIMSMANINTSIKRKAKIYRELRDAGLIQFSKRVDSTNVRVCFIDDGNTVLEITDLRNLGYQYLMYQGEPFFECENCGLVTKIKDPNNKRRQKYCPDCAIKIHMQQKVNSAMRNKISKNL